MIYKNAHICDFETFKKCDIQIKNGEIIALDSEIKESDKEFDAKNKVILPQFIDLNIYPKNKSLSRKALISLEGKLKSGGVGIIALNSDTNPKIDSEIAMEFLKSLNLNIELLPLISATNDNKKICDISILNALGGVGIKIHSNESPNTIDKVAKYAKMLDIPLFIFCDDELGGVINYGELSAKLGLRARNPLSEIKEVAKMLEVAIFYDIKAVFSAISEIRSIELIDEAKRLNPKIACEVSIHHLLLNEGACEKYNTSAKIFPPLKDKKTQEFLLEALKRGSIDVLTSLQCACYNSQKEHVFDEAEFGIDCVMYYFSLLYSNLKNVISLKELSALCSKNPAKILNLKHGEAKKGFSRFMIVDLESSFEVKDHFLPYFGARLNGKVEKFI